MSNCQHQYRRELDQAERRGAHVVSPQQFEEAATREGWQPSTIRLFLTPPLCRKAVLVGKEALRLY